jgi:NADH dehydrogenase
MHHIVIIGGGFGGLYAAKALRGVNAKVSLIDRRNFHLFQPLLYQVATGGLTSGDIAYPLREIFKRQPNFYTITADVVSVDPDEKEVVLQYGEIAYDTLVVATGSSHHYFGHDEWAERAPGLKTVEDALEIRRRIFLAYETAERETDAKRKRALMTFVVVGGGPTGVELAGSLGELARNTLKDNFRNIDPSQSEILLIETLERPLPSYPPDLSMKAERALARLGVRILTQTVVTDIEDGAVTARRGDTVERIAARTVLWGAGVKASPLGEILARRTGVPLDRSGRITTEPDLTVAGYPDIFVIGDLAHFSHPDGKPLQGMASVAIQQGRYAGWAIRKSLEGKPRGRFRYRDKGNMSVIGRNAAVADLGRLRFNGSLAWWIWLVVHIRYLIGFDNKFVVLFHWCWNYLTRKRGARIIIGEGQPFRC